MKKLLLLTLLFFSAAWSFAQDTLVKKTGEEVQVKILELTPDLVKYKRFDNLEGPTISVYKREVFMIRYANGVKEILTPQPVPAQPPVTNPVQSTYKPTPVAPNPQPEEPAPYMMKLNGPRFGVTYIANGELTRKLEERYDITSPVITQFGWQFETQIFNIEGGPSGLIEFVPLIGGLDQGIFLPSASLICGLRAPSGLELGFGPNVSAAGTGVVLAVGTSFTSGNVHFPFNFAVVPSRDGARFSLMCGFNYRKR
jgi:hypothetical protein